MAGFFSLSQCVGYLAFALGVTAFLQKNDRRLIGFNAAQSAAYAVHFALLGNLPGCAASALSGTRSLLALKSSSPWLAALFVALNLGLGAHLVVKPWQWLPVAGACLGTVAMFRLSGIAMRLTLLTATACWLTNNILSGSIGGTALELVIGTANLWTISRLCWARRREARSAPGKGAGA